MFIKRDHRKIQEIFEDVNDAREVLNLSRRQNEFQGSTRIIFHESRLSSLKNLRILNLYDNSLTSLQGIGNLSLNGGIEIPLEEINLGCNKLSSIPMEFGGLSKLTTLWLEDNEFESFPVTICQLKELRQLRLSNNHIDFIPLSIFSLTRLESLSLDNNNIEDFPEGCLQLHQLKHIWLRNNKLKSIPEDIRSMECLETLSVSSNILEALPDGLCELKRLRKLYANGNRINQLPEMLVQLDCLQVLNLANNKIDAVPAVWEEVWGKYDSTTGTLNKDNLNMKTIITMFGNLIN